MKFSEALEKCIAGAKITRRDWNGKGMFVYYIPPHDVRIEDWENRSGNTPLTDKEKEIGCVHIAGHFDMYNAQNIRIIGWLASQTDMSSDEWEVIE